jgi:hypothetical protein
LYLMPQNRTVRNVAETRRREGGKHRNHDSTCGHRPAQHQRPRL